MHGYQGEVTAEGLTMEGGGTHITGHLYMGSCMAMTGIGGRVALHPRENVQPQYKCSAYEAKSQETLGDLT